MRKINFGLDNVSRGPPCPGKLAEKMHSPIKVLSLRHFLSVAMCLVFSLQEVLSEMLARPLPDRTTTKSVCVIESNRTHKTRLHFVSMYF